MTIHPAIQRLRDERVRLGLAQEYVARKAGLAKPTVGAMETGKINPSLAVVEAYANVLGHSIGPARTHIVAYRYEQELVRGVAA